MGIKTNIKISVSLLAVMFAFQNCGSKDNFAGTAAALDLKKAEDQSVQRPLNNVIGEYDVLAISETLCKGDVCSVEQRVFKSKQTINFTAKGSIEGKAACNNFGGAYKLELRPSEGTHLIKIDNNASTLMACALLSEEQDLYEALSIAYKISNTTSDNVSLFATASNKEQRQTITLQLKRKKSIAPNPGTNSLVGNYRVVSVATNVCRSQTNYISSPCYVDIVKFKSQQTISFAKGNVVSCQAACNRFSGKYSYTQRAKEGTDLLSISGLFSTEMACDLLKEENQLFAGLAKVYKVKLSSAKDSSVVLYTDKGYLTLVPAISTHQ